MSVVSTLLAFTLVGTVPSRPLTPATHRLAPAPCITPEHTGTFRMVATRADGSEAVPAVLLLENIDGCLDATFVTDDRAPVIIDLLSVTGDTLKGSIKVTGGPAAVTFRFVGASIAGTIVERRQEWRVEGKRTS